MHDASQIAVLTLYLLALVNPISKVSILAVLSTEARREDFRAVAAKSSLTAFILLFGSMVFGDFLLRSVFNVQVYSLRLAGGAVLFWVGFNALRKGVFFEHDIHARFADIAIVPLACPMIAGPATITASIALRAQYGIWVPACAMLLALGVNHLAMLFSRAIGSTLTRFNLLGALIRITGLIVMALGIQMILDGITGWRAAALM
jgi:multiple antibiotic resistance protein